MLRTYLATARRGLFKRPFYTGLNVLGLAVGLACCLLLGLFVHHEWSYDRFHANADRLYRLAAEQRTDAVRRLALTPADVGPALRDEVPAVQAAVRTARWAMTARTGDAVFADQQLLVADSSFFEVFTFPLRRGDPATALAAPNTVVLTASAARRYFGTADPIGRTLALNLRTFVAGDFTVTGVMDDVPSRSHLQFDGVVSFATIEASGAGAQGGSRYWTYLLLAEGTDPAALAPVLADYVENRYGEAALDQLTYFLQPITDIHLRSDLSFDVHQGRNERVVYLLAVIAAFILVLACVNFTNLSTARSGERAREVGVRKALGAARGGLVGQFLVEALVLALLAALVALVLALLALPAFTVLSGQALTAGQLFSAPVLAALAGVAVLAGMLAGSYPAVVLSAFQPVRVLKGEVTRAGSGARFRQVLVVFQFTVTIALLSATLLAFRQLDYVRGKDLGYDAAGVVSVPVPGGPRLLDRLQAAWSALPGVEAVTADSRWSEGGLPRRLVGRETGDTSFVEVNFFTVAAGYVDVMDVELAAGRGFSPERAGDSTEAALLNEAAVRALGWASPEEAVGQRLRFFRNAWHVIGVTRDFHHGSLHAAVEPLLLQWRPGALQRVLVRVEPDRTREALAALAASWRQVVPDEPFTYAFMDDALAHLYDDDRRQGRLFGLFTGLSVFIACLGLFGLAAFAAEQRTKEVGIRKVLGASVGSLVVLFSREFVVLVALSVVLAVPVAYAGMSRWLEQFAYRIEISGWIFLCAGLVALGMTVLAVGGQAWRAAKADPVESLRYE